MSLGENIRRMRELKNYDMPCMADKLGIGVGTYGNIERGRTKTVSEKRKQQIADVLNVTTDEMENFDPERAIHTITNGDNSTFVNNNSSVVNEHQPELTVLLQQTTKTLEKITSEVALMHKLTAQTLEKVTLLLDKALDKLD